MKEILIANSAENKNKSLFELLEELKTKGFSFRLLSTPSGLFELFKKNGWIVKKSYFGFNLNKKINQLVFLFILPFLNLYYFFFLINAKLKNKINTIICLNINEKLIITPVAKLLGIKIIWIEKADSLYLKENGLNRIVFLIYKTYSLLAKIITFNNFTKNKLKNLGFKEEKISSLPAGIKLNQYEHQENLFNEIARADNKKFHRKFFTVGTVINLNKNKKIETLFQAIKTSFLIIPNLQFIIIGDGEERKNLGWLAKKLGIENITWFVGEQDHLKKWLDSFDLFIDLTPAPELGSFNTILKAMNAKLPIIGMQNYGLEEIISELGEKNGCLIEDENSEALAREIIKLFRDKNLREKIGKAGQEKVQQNFNIKEQAELFIKILL